MKITFNPKVARRDLFILILLIGCMSFLFSDSVPKKNTDAQSRFKYTYNSGEIFLRKGDFQNAIIEFKKSLRLAEENKNSEGEILSSMRLGLLHWNNGQLDLSSEFYERARIEAAEFKLWELEEECQDSLEIYEKYLKGKEFRLSGQHQKSIESFQSAVMLAKKIKSAAHEAKCLRQMSITFWEMDNLNKFYELNEDALELAKKLNHKKEEGRCLNNIGIYHMELNEYSNALFFFLNSLSIAQATEHYKQETKCLNNIGLLYTYTGDFNRATDFFIKSLAINKELRDDEGLCSDLNNIGVAYTRRAIFFRREQDFKKAEIFFKDCLELTKKQNNKKIEVRVLNNIGIIYLESRNYHESYNYFYKGLKEAIKINDLEAVGMVNCNLGTCNLRKGNFEEGKLFFTKAKELGQKIKSIDILFEANFGLGQCYEGRREFDKAIEFYKKSISEIDNIRRRIDLDYFKVGSVRDKLSVYEHLIGLLYEQEMHKLKNKSYKMVFNIVEKAKARAFLEVLGETWFDSQEKISTELTGEKKDISHESPSRMQAKSTGVEKVVFLEPCQLEQVQMELLDQKTALIEFFLGKKQSYLFLIKKDDYDLFPIPPRDKIRNSIKGYLKELSDPPKGKFRGNLAAKRLFNQLLAPLVKNLNDSIENLIIIPDGLLYYLPFEALIMDSEDMSSDPKFLIESFKISYAPSSSSLLFLKKREREVFPPKSLLAIGNPKYSLRKITKSNGKDTSRIFKEIYENQGFDFPPLPYSEREIKEISKFFKRERKDIYLGNVARESLIKNISLEDYQIIHFACHGLHDEIFPFRSGLVLSLDGNINEDGFLLVREISDLKLAADLIVLSACKTGKGKLENIEGVLGLPRIFFYCGAKSVVSSLWEVNDKSTSRFMSHFYKYLSLGKSKSQALRMAKLEMLKSKYCHPFYWASFVLYGDFTQIPIYN